MDWKIKTYGLNSFERYQLYKSYEEDIINIFGLKKAKKVEDFNCIDCWYNNIPVQIKTTNYKDTTNTFLVPEYSYKKLLTLWESYKKLIIIIYNRNIKKAVMYLVTKLEVIRRGIFMNVYNGLRRKVGVVVKVDGLVMTERFIY